MLLFKNDKFEIEKYSEDTLAITVYYPFLANKLNKALNYYPGYKIKGGEEPLFLISEHNFDVFLNSLPKSINGASIKKIVENGVKND